MADGGLWLVLTYASGDEERVLINARSKTVTEKCVIRKGRCRASSSDTKGPS